MERNNHLLRSVLNASILSLYAVLAVFVIVRGDAGKYLHPRFIPFLIAAVALCAAIVPSMIRQSGHYHRELSLLKIAIAVIPLIFGFFVTPAPSAFSGEYISNDGISLEYDEEGISQTVKDARASDIVEINDLNMYSVIQDIYSFPQLYAGKKIAITGLCVRKKNSPENTGFAVIRLLMTCCAADVQPVGMICVSSSDTGSLNGKWHFVRGVITVRTENGEQLPEIQTDSITPAERPDQEYIYPL